MNRKIRLLLLGLLAGSRMTLAQSPDSVLQVVYLIGNTAPTEIPAGNLLAFKKEVQNQVHPFTIIHLGDLLANRGLSDPKGKATGSIPGRATAQCPPAGARPGLPGA